MMPTAREKVDFSFDLLMGPDPLSRSTSSSLDSRTFRSSGLVINYHEFSNKDSDELE